MAETCDKTDKPTKKRKWDCQWRGKLRKNTVLCKVEQTYLNLLI